MTKIYALIWLVALAIMLATFVLGFLSQAVLVAFGFFFFMLTFMGVMSVLPTAVEHEVHHH
jgi:hypothetical protein